MSEKYRRRIYQILMVAVVCFFCAREQTMNGTEKEMEDPAAADWKEETQDIAEFNVEETESRSSSMLPDNETIRESLCSYYHKDDYREISEEELAAAKGKLTAYSLTIHSGEEFALMREWYDWDTPESYCYVSVVFSEDLKEWPEEELEALAFLKCNVHVESSGKTMPARALAYLTGTTDLRFSNDSDMTDVSGTLPEGRAFPRQIKGVSLHAYREGKYKTLLNLLQDSKVETIWVDSDVDMDSRDSHEVSERLQGFWLDDVAGISTLREVILLSGTAIRARDEKALKGSKVKRVLGYADRKTDFGFAGHLPALEELQCDVMEECELQPLLDREGFSLDLHFYEDCPAFYQAVSWPEDESGERTPRFYQRIFDQGRMAECFTGWRDSEKEYWTRWDIAVGNDNPCLRITDGDEVYEIRPVEDEDNRNHTNAAQFMYVGEGALGFRDINFDGTKDLVLGAGRYGAVGPTGTGFAYLWNPGTGRYEFCPSYRWIDNPEVDEERQLIRSELAYSPTGFHSWSFYRYVDGEFVEQSRLTQETLDEDVVSAKMPEDLAVPDSADVIRFQEEIFENGEAVEVKNAYAVAVYGGEGVEIPASCGAYYEEDSYWSDYDSDRAGKVWPKERKEDKRRTGRDAEEDGAAKGESPANFQMIGSGEEFAGMRNSYDLDKLDSDASVIVAFSEDLEEWPEEELEALGMLKCNVYVESRGKTVPAKVLSYFTGATSLYFSYESDMTDVSGTIPEGKCFPQQIKKVRLRNYREGKYKTLLKLLRDSQVEAILVDSNRDTDSGDSDETPEKLPGFWLDDVAGISTLKDVTLYGTVIRVRDEKALEGSGVERIVGCVDQKTDFAYAAGISLYLDIYGDCPALYQAVSWPEEVKGEGTSYIYQRIYDQGRMAECFTELPDGEDEGSGIEKERKNPVLRITDGAAAYEIKPKENGGVTGRNYVYDRIDEIRFQDINFDGTKDLILDAGRLGQIGQWRYEAAYTWNPETARYECCPSYSLIDNPAVDAEHRLVRSGRRDWGNADDGSYSWAIYRYVDGEFVMQSMLTQENLFGDQIPDELSVPEEATLIRYQEKIFENGEAVEEKNAYAVRIEGEETGIPASCEKYYAEDSYWGGF